MEEECRKVEVEPWQDRKGKGVWNIKSVRSAREVRKEAIAKGTVAHFGRLAEMCFEKGSELPDGHKDGKYKGRDVFLGDQVKDQNFDYAEFIMVAPLLRLRPIAHSTLIRCSLALNCQAVMLFRLIANRSLISKLGPLPGFIYQGSDGRRNGPISAMTIQLSLWFLLFMGTQTLVDTGSSTARSKFLSVALWL